MSGKILIILALFALTNSIVCSNHDGDGAKSRFILPVAIRHLFEMLRTLMRKGDVENGLPVMDPMILDHLDISAQNKFVTCNIDISNATITGLAGYELLSPNFNKTDLSMNVELNFSSISLEADYYNMKGNIYNALPLAGEGKFSIKIVDLKICGELFLMQSENGKSILIKEIRQSYYNIKKILSRTRFDGIIDGIFNAIIEDKGADLMNVINKLVAPTLANNFVEFINPYLEMYESWRIIAAIL